VLLLGRSQRSAGDSSMVRHEAEVYRIEGEAESAGEPHGLAVAYERGGRKRVMIDGVASRASELYELVRAVSLGPEDSVIVSGSPSRRRSFVDMHLAQLSRKYLNTLTDYARVVAQRNAALRDQHDASAFDPLLIQYGSAVIHARLCFLVLLQPLVQTYHREIAGGAELAVRYKPSVNSLSEAPDVAEIEERFANHLYSLADRERLLGATIVGPHRDEVDIEIKGTPAREFASQGECRTAAIALKLGVYELLRRDRDLCPVLLDEIFAELDDKRAAALIDAFGQLGQVFLSTASRPPERLLADHEARRFRIADGELAEVN
jgi:DNA replication and repair protein RecF